MKSKRVYARVLAQRGTIAVAGDAPAAAHARDARGGPVQARSEAVPWPGRIVGAVLALMGLLAGCGGDEAKQSTATTRRSPPSATSPLTTATNSSRPSAGSFWSYTKLVTRLSGRTVALPQERVRLDRDLLECNGRDAPVPGGPAPRWNRYTCTQTLFHDGVDRDVTFNVEILSDTQLKITAPRYGPA